MINVTANPGVALDMYETAVAGYMTPVVSVIGANRIQLSFDNGFRDVLTVSGMQLAGDGTIIGGTITALTEHRDGILGFSVDGLSLPVTWVIQGIESGDYGDLAAYLLGSPFTVTGSTFDDRLFSFNGNDTILAGAGDDEIDAGGGVNVIDGQCLFTPLRLESANTALA